MTLRQATIADAEEVARLHIASWQATYVRELPEEFLARLDLGSWTARWQSRIEQGTQVLLAEEDRVLVGFVACGPAHDRDPSSGDEWEVHNIHVHPSRHGQGIGGVLFREAARLGREHGAPALTLWVVRTNLDARTFYEHRGMRLDGGEQKHTVGPSLVFDEVHYRIELPGIVPN